MKPIIEIQAAIRNLIEENAIFVLNDSGGKDSQAMRIILRDIIPQVFAWSQCTRETLEVET